MKKIIYLALVVFAFAACKKDKLSADKTIVGNWKMSGGKYEYYLKGKLVNSQTDTISTGSQQAWQFDSNGNLTLSAYKDGKVDDSNSIKYTYKIQNDSLVVATSATSSTKLAVSFNGKNTLNLTEVTNYSSTRTFYSPTQFDADQQKTTVTFSRF